MSADPIEIGDVVQINPEMEHYAKGQVGLVVARRGAEGCRITVQFRTLTGGVWHYEFYAISDNVARIGRAHWF